MSSEVAAKPHPHFETHHNDNGEVVLCLQSDGQCKVLVEIAANEQEQKLLIANTQKALDLLDKFFDGSFAEVFSGLHIQIGDGLVEGGAQALPSENRIVADRQKMLMSLAEEERLLTKYLDAGDRTQTMNQEEAAAPGSAWIYELIHEVGHLVDEQSLGPARHRVNTSESPTKYGREPDDWHDEKDHEAFAEGFTFMVMGRDVTPVMREAVQSTVKLRSDVSDGQEREEP